MKKRAYRRTRIEDFSTEGVEASESGAPLVLAIDVAKRDMVAALAADREVLQTVQWRHPAQTPQLLAKLEQLRARGVEVEAVMEPSARYDDVLRHQLRDSGIKVFQVSGKKVHDSRVVHDGVPSLHDAKSAAIIAKLHFDRLTSVWRDETKDERQLSAAISTMDMYQTTYLRLVHQLESWMARFWPEITDLVGLTSATFLALLARVGGPRDVAAAPELACELMTGMSHRLMKPAKIEAIVESARTTAGLPLLPEEKQALMTLASEAHRTLRAYKVAKTKLEKLAEGGPSAAIAESVGTTTAAVLYDEVGDPKRFSCAKAYVKAFGLNLKEKSSGKYKGRLRITRYGSSKARKYLWLAVWRWRKADPLAQAWYEAKVKRDGGGKARATTALMRKLAKALFHVGRGDPFDSTKLFDYARLGFDEHGVRRSAM